MGKNGFRVWDLFFRASFRLAHGYYHTALPAVISAILKKQKFSKRLYRYNLFENILV